MAETDQKTNAGETEVKTQPAKKDVGKVKGFMVSLTPGFVYPSIIVTGKASGDTFQIEKKPRFITPAQKTALGKIVKEGRFTLTADQVNVEPVFLDPDDVDPKKLEVN